MDTSEIKAVIQRYFDAGFDCDGGKIREVFHSAAHVYGVDEAGALRDRDRETFAGIVETPKLPYPRQDEILPIDFLGEDTDVARVRTRIGDVMYTDNLSFLRLDGKWTIISKIASGKPANLHSFMVDGEHIVQCNDATSRPAYSAGTEY